ncbi:SDR family NAD(P)-dependent oxidoreductase [Pikeienuella piscinae]|uniref:SDR family NAD(P)-dependent oxidoreductase n=1 Tax=Pikeienuella piscinae TaxID=2748098 RepID=A0A7L5C0U4_9RHOB|nr:SDR family NAD(P)-dependent oxidoreductase [Pikeienuella piscinae]QIE56387.1 SDR family NAD(P)-dependent oxidoreductase [Pikeienuella piscinae]
MSISFKDQVVIVTGAGAGLGRSHALQFAARGAKVVVNDFGGARDGTGGSTSAADAVVAEIVAAGGEAIANDADVSDYDAVKMMADQAVAKWGRIDVLVANAGILRDKSFAKMEIADFIKVLNVHLMGSANCAHAVWPIMRAQEYGRIVFTTSSSGMYGNFGQANYGAAKTGMIGLMNVLQIEGEKYDIRVNTLSPTAVTRMTEELFSGAAKDLLTPESISPGVLFLASKEGPKRTILCAGGGCFARTWLHETEGVILTGDELSPEGVAAHFEEISSMDGAKALEGAFEQTRKYADKAVAAHGAKE